MYRVILVCICTFFSQHIFSNEPDLETLKDMYEKESIYIQQVWGTNFVQNGVEEDIGFFNKNLKEAMKNSPEASRLLENATTNERIGFSLVLASISSLFIVETIATAFTLFLGGYIVGIVYTVIGRNQMLKSIWVHNKEILFGDIK